MKNIVIVGGGYAGVRAAKRLEKYLYRVPHHQDYRILLVEKKSHFYHVIAGLRAGVRNLDQQILIPYDNLFSEKKNKVIQSGALKLEPNVLYLENEVDLDGVRVRTIEFAYMIIATGSRYPLPAKPPSTTKEKCLQHLARVRGQIKEAQHILIVGGGPVGVELTGEILDCYPQKKVSVVHSDSFLGDQCLHPNAKKSLKCMMEKAGVKVMLNDKVILPFARDDIDDVLLPSEPTLTENGHSIQCDLILFAFGMRPNKTWLDTGSGILEKNGFVKTKRTLMVDHPDFENVFVVGDAANLQETKMALRAEQHAVVAVDNLLRILEGSQALKEYTTGRDMMLISFGKNKGYGVIPYTHWYLSSVFARHYKCHGLMTTRQWKMLNQSNNYRDDSSALGTESVC